MEMSRWGKSTGWVVAILVMFLAAASCAEAAILDNIHSRAPIVANTSRNAQPTSREGFLASSNALAGGIGATLTLLSLAVSATPGAGTKDGCTAGKTVGIADELLLRSRI